MFFSRWLPVAAALLILPALLALAPHDDPNGPDAIANSAAPGSGGNGPFESQNMQILSRLSLADLGAGQGNVLGSDCWGWTDSQTGREYALCGMTNATAFVDISEPTDPKFLGRLLTQTGNSAWRDIKVYNDHAFIVSDINDQHGMQVFDLTQLRDADPDNPQIFDNTAFYPNCGDAHNIAINEETGFAYIVGSDRAAGGLHVVNIQDPTQPFEVGDFSADGYTHDVQVISYTGPDPDYADREIALACNEDTLTVVDVTNKSNMIQVARVPYNESSYTHQCWITDDHRYVYLGDEFDERDFGGPTRILVFDCIDLDNPVLLGTYLGETNAVDHNLYVHQGRVYLANYTSGLRVLEIDENDPLNLQEIAFADTYPTDNDRDLDGAWSNYPFYESGNVLVMDRQNGMFVVRITDLEITLPTGPVEQLSPDGGAAFLVDVGPLGDVPEPDTGTLHVDRGNGFETFAMNEISENRYEAVFPELPCGETIRYFVSASSASGVQVCNPPSAPDVVFSALSADEVVRPFVDDFETDQGWTVSTNATEGAWERGVPAGDGGRGDPSADADGSGQCFLTGNEEGNSDLDDGGSVLTSPTLDAIGDGSAVSAKLQYFRWYSNDVGNSPASDIFVVEISNDNGATWTNLETVGPDGNEVSGGWILKSFEIADFVEPTNQMRVRFSASDLGEGSVVEAGVDAVEILLVQCAEAQILLGDANLDGSVNLADIPAFVELLSSGTYLAEADLNEDGSVNLSDIPLFVAVLSGE